MENFYGTWKQEGKAENLQVVLDSTDMTDEQKEKAIKSEGTVTISQAGEKYSFFHSINDGEYSKEYIFALDEPFEATDVFGYKSKSTLKLESPTKLLERCMETSDSVVLITYEIIKDTMHVTMDCKGNQSIMVFNKIA
ncbi:uncharacterized protein LOC115232460 [Argonauta hians]